MNWAFQPLPASAAQQTASGGSYTLAADAGNCSFDGQTASLRRALALAAAPGIFIAAGDAVGRARSLVLPAEPGGHGLAGQEARFAGPGSSIPADTAAFAITGGAAGTFLARRLAAGLGAFSAAGMAAGFGDDEPSAAQPVCTIELGLQIGF